MMEKISWGIIGCGNVTEVKSGPAFSKVPGSQLVAVMRRNKEKAKDYALRHGISRWYNEAAELVADPDVNAIYIATPPLYHEPYALMAIAAGKPVYIEKPVALDAAAARRIADAGRKSGVKISIAHYRRFQPLFLKLRRLLQEEVIGKVRMVELKLLQPQQNSLIAQTEEPWRLNAAISGGGLFHDLAPHQLDLMYHFFGAPQKVLGLAVNTAGLYAADDTVSGQVLFGNNILFNGLWCFVSHPEQKTDQCTITGSKGTIRFSIFEQAPVIVKTEKVEEVFHFDALQHVQQPMIAEVVQYFLGNASNPCPAEEGVAVMQIMDAFTKKQTGS